MNVIFYRSPSGREPVREFFGDLSIDDRAALADALTAIREHGFRAPGIVFRQIRGKLWEFRILGSISSRVFYVTVHGPMMVLLHAYKKQGQKAPPREIAVAERRLKEVEHEK